MCVVGEYVCVLLCVSVNIRLHFFACVPGLKFHLPSFYRIHSLVEMAGVSDRGSDISLSPASGHVICFIHLMSHMSHQLVWILFQVTCLSCTSVLISIGMLVTEFCL